MPSFRLYLLTLCVVLAGCTPHDPLDWKVSAKTPEDFETWRDSHVQLLPDDLREEFTRSFGWFAKLSPGSVAPSSFNDTTNFICRKLNGRMVRLVILEGYELETRELQARISTRSDNILKNIAMTEGINDPAIEQRFDRARRAQAESIETMEKRLRFIETRVNELYGKR